MNIEMRQEKIDEVNEALLDFVLRVANNPAANPAEIQAMPEVAKVVLEVLKPPPIIGRTNGFTC